MNFTFTRDEPAEPEAYSVSIAGRKVGTARRRDAETWDVTLGNKRELPGGDFVLAIKAKDVAELGAIMGQRMGMLPEGANALDVLTDDTAEKLTWGALLTLNALCARTDSLAGFTNGLCRALAQLITEDVKPETEAVFRAKITENVDAHVAAIRHKQKLEQALASQLRTLFKHADDDDEPKPPPVAH